MKTKQEALAYIHGRPKAGKKDSFSRLAGLMAILDHPENKLPEAIHITGTNGKGSVATMVTAIAQAANYRVGTFISPYIVDFCERFQINGQSMSEQNLVFYTNQVKKAGDQLFQDSAGTLIPTEFEVVTAIMFLYFVDQQLDLAVIEVGIGGRYDSTNILTTTKVAVITTVALDHQALLGKTVEKIADQKAGIIKKGVLTVLGPNVPVDAIAVIKNQAKTVGSPVHIAQPGSFHSALAGTFQVDNTATAVLAVKSWRPQLTPAVIQRGLDQAFIPGRFEEIQSNLYLDGAHNPAGIAALHQSITDQFNQPVTVLLGSLADKDLDQAIFDLGQDPQITLGLVPFAGIPGRPGRNPGKEVTDSEPFVVYDSLAAGMAANAKQPIIVTGSLYFISDVRRKLWQKKF